MRRNFSKRQKLILSFLSGGKCSICKSSLEKTFHGDHVWAYSKGGPTVILNGQALCGKCNLKKGAEMLKLRPWQQQALDKCIGWLTSSDENKHFLINAAPGAGKTKAACAISKKLFDLGLIDRVVVIAPRVEVVKQWARDFFSITGKYMARITGEEKIELDVAITWSAIQNLTDVFSIVCEKQRVLVICDEHHHAAVEAAWGKGANSAFKDAKYALILSGTPIRSDSKSSIWLAYDDEGAINHPEGGTFSLSYGEAVDLQYCRPATFHRHEGKFTVDLEDGEKVTVSSKNAAQLSKELKRIPGLQRSLEFYKLACVPQYQNNKKTPKTDGYQGTMVEWAISKLDDLRLRMPNAGGLVIAPSIEVAEYMVKLIELLDGETPTLVHSQLPNADTRIESFRHTDKRWIVSVAMISEGVDISRLRVLIYLPNALTELAFRQAIGRVVRTFGPDDDTRAYVIMPSFDILENYARRVEDEMSPSAKKEVKNSGKKKCPVCESENKKDADFCDSCGFEFPKIQTRLKQCHTCGHQNPIGLSNCQNCGAGFGSDFILTLDEALRTGAIVRGMDINESDVKAGEEIAEVTRKSILSSGDERLIKVVKLLPEESWAKLRQIFRESEE